MKVNLLYASLIILIGCSNNEVQLSELKTELEKAEIELLNCSSELAELKNTSENRLIQAKRFLAEKDLVKAKAEFQGIVDNFKGTKDAINASNQIKSIEKEIVQEKIEAEKKKALGFKVLKPNNIVEYEGLRIKVEKIWKGKRWSFDDYGNKYSFRDAKRGQKHIMARITIKSQSNNPSLPSILTYQMKEGRLIYLGTLKYRFRRWKDYGSYLGNYADYGNDFAHSESIPFNCGIEIPNNQLENGDIYIVLKKQDCFYRTTTSIGNPAIKYQEGSCSPKKVLTVADFEKKYTLLKILQ